MAAVVCEIFLSLCFHPCVLALLSESELIKGIEECKIRSIILPLLADHVLREANHLIRLLNE